MKLNYTYYIFKWDTKEIDIYLKDLQKDYPNKITYTITLGFVLDLFKIEIKGNKKEINLLREIYENLTDNIGEWY